MGRYGWLAVGIACLTAGSRAAAVPDAYFVFGYHGGYYLTPEDEYARCLDKLFGLLERDPKLKFVIELEPYTLEAMKHGERFEVERHGRSDPLLVAWQFSPSGVERTRQAAHDGDFGMRLTGRGAGYVNLCQPLPAGELRNQTLTFSGWIRARTGQRVHIYADAWSAVSSIPGSAVNQAAPPDGQWHRVSLRFLVPGDAYTVFPQAKIDGEGEGGFDALSLTDASGHELLANGSFETVATPQLKDERRLADLKRWQQTGRLEIVGGAYTQPILYTIGDESAARQFAYGTRAVTEAIGAPVRVYAAQEPGMSGQVPQLLRLSGTQDVLYRTHWCIFGSPPGRNAQVVWWTGPDGTRAPAVPAYEFTPLIGYGLPGWPTRGYLAAAKAAGVEQPLFTQFADLVTSAIPDETTALTSGMFEGWANLCRAVPAGDLAARRLVLSAQLRARKPGGHLYIDAHTPDHVALGGVKSANVPPDGEWHRVELSFTVPAGVVTMFPQARIIAAEGDLDVAEPSLAVADDKRELLTGPFIANGKLGPGWGAGTSETMRAETTLGEGGGRQWARLVVYGEGLNAAVTTLGEYFDLVGKPQDEWADAYRGFEHRFPWGLLGGRLQRGDRLAEDAVLGAERLTAITGAVPWAKRDDAWRLLLMQEHHDGWVCAPVLFGVWRGYDSYAAFCRAAGEEARKLCDEIRAPRADAGPTTVIRVLNVCGHEREDFVGFHVELPPGAARDPQVFEPKGAQVAAELTVRSTHPDGSAREVAGRFLARVPAMASRPYTLSDRKGSEQAAPTPPQPPLRVANAAEGLFQVYRSDGGEPLLRGPARLTGHFANGDQWDRRSEGQAPEGAGDREARAHAAGEVGGIRYECTAEPALTAPIVHLRLKLDFGEGVSVGATEDSERAPKWAKPEQKLRLVLPLPFERPRFLEHEPFEVRPVPAGRAHCVRYAIAEGDEGGVALFADRATDLFLRADPPSLELTLGYGGGFIYAPGERAPLTGTEEYELALLFYQASWADARVPEVADDLAHPLMALPGTRTGAASGAGRLSVAPEGAVVVTAVWRVPGALCARLWRPYPGEAEISVALPGGHGIYRADLAGERQSQVAEGDRAKLRIRCNEIVTLAAPMS